MTDTSHRGRRSLIVAATIALITATLAVTASASAAPRSFYGVAPQSPLDARQINRMGQGNVGTLRLYFDWATIDAAAPAGGFNWASTDGLVAQAARNGIRVLPFLYGTPEWVARGLDKFKCSRKCNRYAPRSGKARRAWKKFVGGAVDRYGPNGSLWSQFPGLPKTPVRAWQIWNEQNSPTFYKPKPKVKRYAKLLDASKKAIRSRHKGADVVLGGMAGLTGVKKATPAWTYLRNLYRRKGAKRDFDAVAPHPYGAKLKKVAQQVNKFRRASRKGRDRKVKMYVTEIGWGSEVGGNPLNRGAAGQATRLKQAFKYFRKKKGRYNVKTVIWFSFADSANEICSWCANSGLFTQALEPKPSWRAFTKFTGGS